MSQINVGAAIVAVAFDFEYTSYVLFTLKQVFVYRTLWMRWREPSWRRVGGQVRRVGGIKIYDG